MKKVLLISTLLFSINSFAMQLHTYDSIAAAIKNGTPIHIVTDYNQCQFSLKARPLTGTLIGSFTPNEIGVNDSHIATALTHFTLNDPFFPGKPVYEHDRFTITPDNTLTVDFQVLDATNYASLINPMKFTCSIDVATKIYT